MSEVANIPQLRFPEFSDDWEASKLGDITSKIGSGSTPRGGEKVIHQMEFYSFEVKMLKETFLI